MVLSCLDLLTQYIVRLCDLTADKHEEPADDVTDHVTARTLMKSVLFACDCSVITDVPFVVFVCGSVLAVFGYVVPFVFLPSRAINDLNVDASTGASLIALLAVAMTVGRLASGVLGDRRWYDDHRLVLYSTLMFLCGLSSVTVVWLQTFVALAAYSVVFGFLAGITTLAENFSELTDAEHVH